MKRIPFGFILGFILLVFLGEVFHLFEHQELGLVDLRFRLRGPQPVSSDLVIVEINDASIKKIGHWPWPRSYHAALLKILNSYHPRLIFYDVLFTEESTQPQEDELLSHAVREAGNVVSAFFFRSEKPFSAFFPIPSLQQASRALGYVNIFADLDGKTRRIRKEIQASEGNYYHTSVVTLLSAFSEENEEKRRRRLDRIPTDREGAFWVNFPGDYTLFPRVPFHQILEAEGPWQEELREFFQDKIVLVGQTATGGGDFRPNPFSPAYPGVGIQASSLHTLLTEQYLRRPEGLFSLPLLLFLGLIVAFFTWGQPHRLGLIAVLVLSVFYLIWNFLAFYFLGWILPLVSPLVVMWGLFVLILFLQYVEIHFKGELLARELSLAARIQESFLPRERPSQSGIDVGFLSRFAKEVGGDLYDWVELGERRFGICVGDVSGKGVPAALYMARVTSEWRSLAKNYQSPSALLEALNERLVAAGVAGMFVTFLYLIFDLDSRTVLFSNAGHEPFFFKRSREGQSEWVKRASAQPLGLFPGTRYPEEKISFDSGTLIVMISDGVRELRNPKGREWGLGGAAQVLETSRDGSAGGIIQQFFRAMDVFSNGNPAHDDRTVVCIKT